MRLAAVAFAVGLAAGLFVRGTIADKQEAQAASNAAAITAHAYGKVLANAYAGNQIVIQGLQRIANERARVDRDPIAVAGRAADRLCVDATATAAKRPGRGVSADQPVSDAGPADRPDPRGDFGRALIEARDAVDEWVEVKRIAIEKARAEGKLP